MNSTVFALWEALHACPELSGHEHKTLHILTEFLRAHTALELTAVAGGLVATHREQDGPTVLIRADMDAIVSPAGAAYHGCGHDGHMAVLAGLACLLNGKRLGRSVLFVFQPAEETGQGAKALSNALLETEQIDRAFGFHNIPGYAEGTVLLRSGTFACASEGLILEITGKQAHAAHPEQGENPAPLLASLVCALDSIANSIETNGLTMATIVGLQLGGRNFGVSAGSGELCLTLRAHRQEDMDALEIAIARWMHAHAGNMAWHLHRQDVFPDTANDSAVFEQSFHTLEHCGYPITLLPEPMRWSEDFGWFLKRIPGMYLGIGAGENWPGLHTDDYCFNPRILSQCMDILKTLILSA